MNIIQSMTSFLVSDPISFNQSLGNRCQIFCSKDPSPNILSRFVIGVIIKDVTRISDIALHIIVGLAKLTICAIKLIYSIPARFWGSIPNYEIGKEDLAHLGFSTFYLADIFISLTNIINRYPKDLIEKVESFFYSFLSSKINEEARETPLEEPQTSSSESEADSDASSEKKPLQLQENPLYQALLKCGTDPETSKTMVSNYENFPKHFRASISSTASKC